MPPAGGGGMYIWYSPRGTAHASVTVAVYSAKSRAVIVAPEQNTLKQMVLLSKAEQNASRLHIIKTFHGSGRLTLESVSDRCSALQTQLICSFVIRSLWQAEVENGWNRERDEARLTIPASCKSRIKSSAIFPV